MNSDVIVTEQDTLITSVPTPHPTYPGWEEGSTAPKLYQRLGNWTPGFYPPASAADPMAVMADRLESHRALWAAVQSWERNQARLDARADAIRRSGEAVERQRAERAAAEERAAEDERKATDEHTARLQRLHADAAAHGFTIAADEHDGKERVRLAAPPGHVSLGSMFPWHETPRQVHVPGAGILVPRVDGETLDMVEQFIIEWPELLRHAMRANPKLRQNMLDGLRNSG